MPDFASILEKRRNKRAKTQELQRHYLDDINAWYHDSLGLRVNPPPVRFDQKGTPRVWVDMRPGSAYLRRIDFWRQSWKVHDETGAFVFMDMEPRDSGKSIVMLAESLRLLCEDRGMTIGYGAQTGKKATERAKWLKKKLTSPTIQARFGKMRGDTWSNEELYLKGNPYGDQPNVFLFSPGMTITGKHPRLWVFDDFVDQRNSRSFALQQQVFASWGDVMQAADHHTIIWIIGTPWPGIYHLYDKIADEFGEDAIMRYVPWQGPAIDQHQNVVFGTPGQQNFPWIDEQFIERQRRNLDEHEFIGAYMVVRAHRKNRFQMKQFIQKRPPTINGEPFSEENLDRRNCTIYMVTDPANNKGGQRGMSKAAIAVAAKYSDSTCYVLDMVLDHMTSDVFLEHFDRLWKKWKPFRYSMETSGPGNMYKDWITKRYEAQGLEVPPLRTISRPFSGRKEDRILCLNQPLKEEKLYWAPTVDPDIIDWDGHSLVPMGKIPEEATRFNPDGNKETLDGLDCIGDLYWIDSAGTICPPPEYQPNEQIMTPHQMQKERMKEMVREALDRGAGLMDSFTY